jgi:Concanavalin A-like lectin/glucanases superfamily
MRPRGVAKLTTTTTLQDQTEGVEIGAGAVGPAALLFNGKIDDVRIYNRALTAAEIKTLYQLGTFKITSH